MNVTIISNKPEYEQDGDFILFNQGNLPRMIFVLFGQLGVPVTMLKDNHYHYMVTMTESEFLSCLEMATELQKEKIS